MTDEVPTVPAAPTTTAPTTAATTVPATAAPVATIEPVATAPPSVSPAPVSAPAAPPVGKGFLIGIGAAVLCALGLIGFVLFSGEGSSSEDPPNGNVAPVNLTDADSPFLLLVTNTEIDLDGKSFNTIYARTCYYVDQKVDTAVCDQLLTNPEVRVDIPGADVEYGPPFRPGLGIQLYDRSHGCPSAGEIASRPANQDPTRPAICVVSDEGNRFAIYQTSQEPEDAVNVLVLNIENGS